MQPENRREVIRNLPLIPLRDMVVFPSTLVPFIIGRESSIRALEKASSQEKLVFLSAQMDASIDIPQPRDIYMMGIIAKIIRVVKMDNNNIKVIVEGKKRARIIEFLSIHPFHQVLAKEVKEIPAEGEKTKEILGLTLALFEDYLKLRKHISFNSIIPSLKENSPGRISDIIASHLYLSIYEKQNILETINQIERLQRMNYILEGEIIKIHSSLKKEGKTPGKNNYFYKQSGTKVFPPGITVKKQEKNNEIEELRKKIAKAKMPKDAEEKSKQELERLEVMPPMSAEATVCRNYLDWIISLPWNKKSREKRELKVAERILNEDHYGLEKIKERILEYLSIRQLVKNPKGVVLGFVGPPGVGKSSLGHSIARATGRKFIRLSLGGVRDEAEIRGHRRTYIGAYPGRIIQMIKKAGTKNPVFLLDEVDKMSVDFRGDPASALMEVLDPEQNNTFLDHYIDTEFDLSQVIFIVTANVIRTIPRPLLDRMEVIRLPGYTEEEKLQIGKRFLLPKQMKAHGLKEKNLNLSNKSLQKLIREYTREAGVRNLEREITSICRKVVKKVVTKGKSYEESISPRNLGNFLGIPRFKRAEIDKKEEIGVAVGMAWTEFGGELLTFEVTKVHGKGNFIMTGQLGDVMQESAKAAFSYVKGKMFELNVARDLHKNFDIHIHVPEAATPKEGPSAGITLATAIISLLLEIPVNKNVAMSGELTLKGKVLSVGGIKEKLLAAHREGIREVVFPLENMCDLKDIPKKIKAAMKINFVETMDQVLKIVLSKKIPEKIKDNFESEETQEPSIAN